MLATEGSSTALRRLCKGVQVVCKHEETEFIALTPEALLREVCVDCGVFTKDKPRSTMKCSHHAWHVLSAPNERQRIDVRCIECGYYQDQIHPLLPGELPGKFAHRPLMMAPCEVNPGNTIVFGKQLTVAPVQPATKWDNATSEEIMNDVLEWKQKIAESSASTQWMVSGEYVVSMKTVGKEWFALGLTDPEFNFTFGGGTVS